MLGPVGRPLPVAREIHETRRDAELDQACEGMEALFLKQLLSEMRRSGGTVMRGPGGEVYQELFDQELAQHLARASDLGVARLVREQVGATKRFSGQPETLPGLRAGGENLDGPLKLGARNADTGLRVVPVIRGAADKEACK